MNTENDSFHLITSSIDYIGDSWKLVSYKIDENFSLSFFNIIDADSIGYNFGFRASSFYDSNRNNVVSSGFDFSHDDGVLCIQDSSEPTHYSINRYVKQGFNALRQGKILKNKYFSIGYSRVNSDGQVWLVQTDTNGVIVWEKEYGTPEYDDGYSLELTTNGQLYLLGESRGYGLAKGFYTDALLIKTDSLGNELWRTTWGGYFNDCANNLAATPDGGVIACGCISEEFSNGNSNVAQGYVRKMDAEGNLVWDKKFDWQSALLGGSVHSFSVVRVLENENIIVVGSGAKLNVDTTESRTTPWAVIFDKNGNVLMERAYTGLVGDYSSAEFQDIQPTADGGFIAGGTYYPSQGDTGNQDAFIVKLDERGCEFADCQPTLAVEELSDVSFQLSGWPNPAQDVLNIKTDSPMERIEVFSQIGARVFSGQFSVGSASAPLSTQNTIDVSSFKTGLYFLVVKTARGVETKKFVKAN